MAQTIGFDYVNIAILDKNENVVTGADGLAENGVFRVDAKSALGVISAAISGLAPSTSKIFGSNQNVDVSGKGTGNIQCTLGVNDLPAKVINKLLGYKQDNGAWYADKDTRAPYAAIELVSSDRKGNRVYIGLPKGMFSPETRNLQTNTETEQRTTDSIQFSALNRYKDAKAYIEGWTTDASFQYDSFIKDLFPGGVADDSVSSRVNPEDSGTVTRPALSDNK